MYEKMVKFEGKMRGAEDRYFERQAEIVQRGQQRASIIAQKREEHEEALKQRWHQSFARTVHKQADAKKKDDQRVKQLNDTVEKLQENHRAKQEKVQRQQEEERRFFRERIEGMSEKMRKVEEKVSRSQKTRAEVIQGRAEKKRLLFEDKDENQRRIKAMKANYHI